MTVPRLPVPGQDSGNWGNVLNEYLSVEHTANGSLKFRTDGTVPLLISGKVLPANLGSGTASSFNYLRGDGTWAVPISTDTTKLAITNNLSELSASASTARTNLGLGSAATISSTAGGDLSGTLPNPTVTKLNGTVLADLATGLLKNTTSTGVPSIATAADIPDLSSTYGRKADIVVIATGAGAVDTAAIQAAITSNPGKTIFIAGVDTTLTTTLTISTDRTNLDGNVKLTAGFTGGPMLRVLNASYNHVGDGLFFDGNWQSGVSGVELMGALLGQYHVKGDRLSIGINLDSANVAATQNSALNELWLTLRNGIKGIVFTGKNTQYASNNRIHRIDFWGAASASAVGMEFAAYCDNNCTDSAYIHLTASGHIGVAYNTQTPASDLQVYENHFDGIIEAEVAGATAIKGNRTWGSLGRWPTYVRLRLSGAITPTIDLRADCDIVYRDSNMNGAPKGAPGQSQILLGADTIAAVSTATLGLDWTCPIWTLPKSGNSSVRFSTLIPAEWRAYRVDMLWAPSNGVGGNAYWTLTLAHLGSGFDINDGAVTNVAGAAGTNINRVTTTTMLASQAIPTGSTLMWAKLARTPADALDTATADARLIGVLLTRTL